MERSSPSRTAGVCVRKVTVGGVGFTLSEPDRVRKAADEEAVVIARRQLPRGLAPEDRPAAINAMIAGIASPEEWGNYYRSLWQLAFRFWNALDPADKLAFAGTNGKTPSGMLTGVEWAHQELSGDEVTRQEVDDLWGAIRMVSQEDPLKNLNGSSDPGATQSPDAPATAAGQQSTASS